MDNEHSCKPVFRRERLLVLLIIFAGVISYVGTLNAPFMFDDIVNILENPSITGPRTAASYFYDIHGPMSLRPLTLASLAFNYHIDGFNPRGYHVLNIFLHILNALLLYWLVIEIMRHLRMDERWLRVVPLFSALIFVSHPVQTESVTYIVTRSNLIYSAFYLSGVIVYLHARTDRIPRRRAMALLFLVCMFGIAAREDFVTFVAVIAAFEYLVVSGGDLRKASEGIAYLIPVLTAYIYLAYLVTHSGMHSGSAGFGTHINSAEYFLTECRVHFMYLRLILLPVNQNLDYDIPLAAVGIPAMPWLAGYAGLWIAAIAAKRQSPVTTFCMIWFLVNITPASSIVPLDDLAFEHRLYLPSAGIAVLMAIVMGVVSVRLEHRPKLALVACAMVVVLLAAATLKRNEAWESPLTLWGDVVQQSPMKVRGHNNLGKELWRLGELDRAREMFEHAAALDPYHAVVQTNLGAVLLLLDRMDDAHMALRRAIALDPDNSDPHHLLGTLYMRENRLEDAVREQGLAVKLNPDSARNRYWLGLAYQRIGMLDDALRVYQEATYMDPYMKDAHVKVIEILMTLGRKQDAVNYLKSITEGEP